MIAYQKFTLENGLRVIVHTDKTTPMATLNVLYNVGARDEDESRTGFAHLFEHLMFGGSINVPVYDEPLQMAGGENNAYTTNDFTNYYIQLPKENMETAFWLESDRMLNLAFSKKSLDTQRKVVCEEFKENYLNKPYGDVFHYLRELCYKVHPYKWLTIGKELKHIEDAQLQDVKDFFAKHYTPCNAILCVAGNVELEEVKALCEKWFAPIPAGNLYTRNLPIEPQQTKARKLVVEKDVPVTAIYKAYHMGDRLSNTYHAADLITEILGGGQSARLYENLVKDKKIFTSIECYHMGTLDPGIIVLDGKLAKDISIEVADAALEEALQNLMQNGVTESELQKAKNKTEAMITFEDLNLLNRANNLAFYELVGDAEQMNTEWEKYNAVTIENIKTVANTIFKQSNGNTLWYMAKNN
jgi:zinc protease